MLSRSCDGCEQQRLCARRYRRVQKGEVVYCPSGLRHLVDEASMEVAPVG